jgi:hypothetical protein
MLLDSAVKTVKLTDWNNPNQEKYGRRLYKQKKSGL